MRYLFLLWGDEAAELALSDDERRAIVLAHGAFLRGLRDAGREATGEPLGPSRDAVIVAAGRRPSATDGPFLETKEQLGGFYLLECNSLDEAIELAAKIPGAQFGSVEVRPVMNYEGAGAEDAQQSAAAHN